MPSLSRAATISLSLLTGLTTAGDQHGDENSQRGSAALAAPTPRRRPLDAEPRGGGAAKKRGSGRSGGAKH